LGFANATSLARNATSLARNATSQIFLPSFARQMLAALAIQLGIASRIALFYMFRKMYVYFLVTFFIVSILIAGMACKQGTINFGQKWKAPEPDVEKSEKLMATSINGS
jgi:hypothetical protein